MKNIYLYGASDDCMECEVRSGSIVIGEYESYTGIRLNDVLVRYAYDGDWGVWLEGDVPVSWQVVAIRGNCANAARNKGNGGQFLHIMIPDSEPLNVVELDGEDE